MPSPLGERRVGFSPPGRRSLLFSPFLSYAANPAFTPPGGFPLYPSDTSLRKRLEGFCLAESVFTSLGGVWDKLIFQIKMLQAMFLRNPTFIPLDGKAGFTPLGGISDKLIFQMETSQVTSLRQPAFIPLGGLR